MIESCNVKPKSIVNDVITSLNQVSCIGAESPSHEAHRSALQRTRGKVPSSTGVPKSRAAVAAGLAAPSPLCSGSLFASPSLALPPSLAPSPAESGGAVGVAAAPSPPFCASAPPLFRCALAARRLRASLSLVAMRLRCACASLMRRCALAARRLRASLSLVAVRLRCACASLMRRCALAARNRPRLATARRFSAPLRLRSAHASLRLRRRSRHQKSKAKAKAP